MLWVFQWEGKRWVWWNHIKRQFCAQNTAWKWGSAGRASEWSSVEELPHVQVEQKGNPGSYCGWETKDWSKVSWRLKERCVAGKVKMPSQEKYALRALISQRISDGYCKWSSLGEFDCKWTHCKDAYKLAQLNHWAF